MALSQQRSRDKTEVDEQELERRRFQRRKNQPAIGLLDRLINVGDEAAEEQRETLEYVSRVLNEDRLSDRDRFPKR